MEGSNIEQQNEEIEVLQSIYEDDVQLTTDYDNPGSTRSFTIAVPGPYSIQLSIHLPITYPSEDAPIATVSESLGLTNRQCEEITQDLAAIFERANGQVCLYEWIENVREKYSTVVADADERHHGDTDTTGHATDGNTAPSAMLTPIAFDPEAFRADPHTLRPRVRSAQQLRDPEREARLLPLIYHGTTLTDRKSTFQGHACPVHSVEDVRSFLSILMDDRKIARAIHNMLAYRIVGAFVVKDNDEDGEDGAGSKMSHLLELVGAENVAVVVTRWFGGILLGPDRFKHINTSARQALDDGGFLTPSPTPTPSSSTAAGKKKNKR